MSPQAAVDLSTSPGTSAVRPTPTTVIRTARPSAPAARASHVAGAGQPAVAADEPGERLQAADADLEVRFTPALDRLAHVIAGGRFDAAEFAQQPRTGRRILGWAAGPYWAIHKADVLSRA